MQKGVSGVETTLHPERRRLQIRKLLTRAGAAMSTEDIHAELVKQWGHRVNPRTTRRDLSDLATVGYVRRLPKGAGNNHRSWYWAVGKEALKLAFSPEESMTLTAVLQHAERFGFWLDTEEFQNLRDYAQGSIQSQPGGRLIAEGRITSGTRFTVLQPGQHRPEHLADIQKAMLASNSLKIRYRPRDADGVECTYILRPLALAYLDSNIYLTAYVQREEWHGKEPDPSKPRGKYSSNGPKMTCALMLHRMLSVSEARDDVQEPPEFDASSFAVQKDLITLHSAQEIELVLNLNDNLHNRLTENALAPEQKVERDGNRWKLTCKILDTQGLRLFLMSNASGMTVEQPHYLREHILGELRSALAQYLC